VSACPGTVVRRSSSGAHGYDAVSSEAAIELITRWFPRINLAA
jgi:hypothetical protein